MADTPRVFLTLGVRPCGAVSQDLDVDGGLGDNPRKSLPDIKPCVCMLPTPPLDFVMVLKSNFIQITIIYLFLIFKTKMLICKMMLDSNAHLYGVPPPEGDGTNICTLSSLVMVMILPVSGLFELAPKPPVLVIIEPDSSTA